MNKSFILLDKTNNVQKNANTIIKFTLEGKDYLTYSIDENEQNKQIFVSKLIVNSEGKYFIEDISPEEKNKLSNIVYNIVILTPSNAQKGGVANDLINELTEKFSLTFSLEIPDLNEQEYFSNCSIAITGKEFVEEAVKFYGENIKAEQTPVVENESVSENMITPTWTIPSEVIEEPQEVSSPIPEIVTPVVPQPVVTENNIPEITSIPEPTNVENSIPEVPASEPIKLDITPEVTVEQTGVVQAPEEPALNIPNPQAAIVSDPSLGLTNANMQPNVGKKNAGFAINKYIVIGTICIVAAIAVVVVAYLLIQKKINGA